MKVGDLVKIKEREESALVHVVGMVLDFKPRGFCSHPDPDCDVWNDAIVYWAGFGVAFHMRCALEVVNESR